MTLRELIETLNEIAGEEGDQLEVVAHGEVGEGYTPVISVYTAKDGVRRVYVA